MSIKKAAKAVSKRDLTKRPKTNRTLSLDYESYEAFLEHCRRNGLKASNVVEELVQEYLKQISST